jgi:hypothetical protein
MGSFAYTCCISGLPIEAGDKVRYFLLSANPYTDSSKGCYMTDFWFPRCFPLRAEYNDYGSVEEVEEGPARDLWMRCLRIDLRKRGWGDNSCHDVPTSKHMNFDELLNAVQEWRVKVRQNVGDEKPLSQKVEENFGGRPLPPGIATIKRVQEAIEGGKLPFFDGNWGKNGLMVDLVTYGTVRVRWHSAGAKDDTLKKLEAVQKLLPEYATVIRAGDGAYAERGDLMVFTKPGTKDFHGGVKEKKRSLLVQQAMIREDVWQALLSRPVEHDYGKFAEVAQYRAWARELWDASVKVEQEWRGWKDRRKGRPDSLQKGYRTLAGFLYMDGVDKKNRLTPWVAKDAIPFTVGLGTNWIKMVQRHVLTPLTKEQVSAWLDTVAEFGFIHAALMPIRYWWRPSYSCGPQFGEPRAHEVMLKSFADIAKGLADKLDNEREESERG